MNRTSRIVFVIAFIVFIGVPILWSAPSTFGHIYDYYHKRNILEKSFTSCAPDELLIAIYYDKNGSESATLNFTTKTLEGGDSNPLDTWYWFGETESSFFNMKLGPTLFTDEQIGKIKSLLAALPPSKATGASSLDSYRDQFHLAFYQDGQLCIYHYSKGEAQSQLEQLCQALQVTFHLPSHS